MKGNWQTRKTMTDKTQIQIYLSFPGFFFITNFFCEYHMQRTIMLCWFYLSWVMRFKSQIGVLVRTNVRKIKLYASDSIDTLHFTKGPAISGITSLTCEEFRSLPFQGGTPIWAEGWLNYDCGLEYSSPRSTQLYWTISNFTLLSSLPQHLYLFRMFSHHVLHISI